MNTKISILVFSSLFICAAQAAQALGFNSAQDPDIFDNLSSQPTFGESAKSFGTTVKSGLATAWSCVKPETQERIKKGAALGVRALAGYGLCTLGLNVLGNGMSLIEDHVKKVATGLGVGLLGYRLWPTAKLVNAQQKRLDEQRLKEREQQVNEQLKESIMFAHDLGRHDMKLTPITPIVLTEKLTKKKNESDSVVLKNSSFWFKTVQKFALVGLAGYAAMQLVPKVASLIKNNPKTAALGLGTALVLSLPRSKKRATFGFGL